MLFVGKTKKSKQINKQVLFLLTFQFDRQKAELDKNYERRLQDTNAETTVAMVAREKEIVNAESALEIAVTLAEEQAAVQKLRAESGFDVVTAQAEQENAKLLAKVESDSKAQIIQVEEETKVRILESEKGIEIAENKSAALITEAKAEGEAAEAFKKIREHNLEMAKLEITEAIARRAKVLVSGTNGDKLLASIIDSKVLGDIKL